MMPERLVGMWRAGAGAALRLLVAGLLFGGAAMAAPPPSPPLAYEDLVGEFAAFRAQSEGLGDEARIAAFEAHFADRLPGFYSRERVGSPRYGERILEALRRFPEDQAGIEAVRSRFAALLEPAQRSFEAEFGPMQGFPPIVLLHSVGEMDGGTRSLPGGVRLVFGADMMARLHGDHDVRPFFHHELFHLLHSRRFTECGRLWCDLWSEGLATLVAERLNPGATDAQLLLTIPEPLRPRVEANRQAALCLVARHFDSEDPAVGRALFQFGDRIAPELPNRAGYYIGWLVAAEAAKGRSLADLAALDAEQARPVVAAALASLADCHG